MHDEVQMPYGGCKSLGYGLWFAKTL